MSIDVLSLISFLIGIVSIVLAFYFYRESTKQLKDNRKLIDSTQELISNTSHLLKVSDKIGIKNAYENRQIALETYKDTLLNTKKLIVIGTSLKGLRMYVPKLDEILRARSKEEVARGLENRFILAHPCYAALREKKEARKEGNIQKEIEDSLAYLTSHGIKKEDIRLYNAVPTNFVIITDNTMLINPYPYEVEAYKCFCLEVDRKKIQDADKQIQSKFYDLPILLKDNEIPDVCTLYHEYKDRIYPSRRDEFLQELDRDQKYHYLFNIAGDIYSQFYWYHYLLPWYSKESKAYSSTINMNNCCQQICHKKEDAKSLKPEDDTQKVTP